MVTRTPGGNAQLVKVQYGLLKAAVNDYFDGVEARALDVAVRIRTLVHNTGNSHPFVATIDPTVYEVHNNGAWYNFGYLFGLACFFGGGGKSSARRKKISTA
ncbi:MAG TPA: hypothetical protein VFR42_07870, partial [Candidatus Acidoferrum sp.]|nr:hypothetical protein [Candidatus Acidoferrum sp.]